MLFLKKNNVVEREILFIKIEGNISHVYSVADKILFHNDQKNVFS